MPRLVLPLLLALGLAPAPLAAQAAPPAPDTGWFRATYTKREVMIPMRDGVRLFTAIYVPKDTTRTHPFVMTRTPYSSGPYGADRFPRLLSYIPNAYAHEGMILVNQDVRGQWMSEGEFMDVRPVVEHRTSHDVDETTDTWDTVDWLVKNVAGNNGRVGVRGTSYPGFYAEMAAIDAHPAVKVVSPQAPVTEWMGGDDFFHNGALLEQHSFFFNYFGRPRPQPTSRGPEVAGPGTPDGYEWAMRLGALSHLNARLYHDSVAFWDSIVAHPTWDAFWAARSGRPHLRNLKPAMLWVGGWFDTENLWGALHAYAAAERQSPGAENRLVMGPWHHGQWNVVPGDSLGDMAWGSATSRFYSDSIEIPFFNYYLLDSQPAPRKYEAAVFETGRNAWRFVDAWPPATEARNLYLHAQGAASFQPPRARGRALFDQYVSDPAKPVPYTDEITQWYDPGFMVGDQRFAARRPDVLVWQTPPLDTALTVAGPIGVDLTVSTTGTDQDFVVKLIDVFPDDYGHDEMFAFGRPSAAAKLGGYQMLVRGDVMRGKFRNSTARPEPFRPGAPTAVRFTMNDVYHTFRPGHRLMVQVQSTWFPMIDRNPGRFEDIYRAKDADFRATTQRVYRSADLASHLVLPVLP
ncbi:MAG TPA: CocE/NonD family hydrolase [Gemmatimonadales bacterium]|nr:CocE/NonD family hydrolase [Gemmatimonadales bacterium]